MDDAPILLDFESRSRADLPECGGRLYWEHPSTAPLCCVLHDTATGERLLWLPGDPPPPIAGRVLGAHNWRGFDRFGAARLGWPVSPDLGHIDTSELARMVGYPGGLDGLATRWLGRAKDKEGSEYTKALSQCRRPAGKRKRGVWSADRISPEEWRTFTAAQKRERGVQPEVTHEALERVVTYCDSDVDVIVDSLGMLAPMLEYEPDVRAADYAVNDRGVAFDVQLARRLLELDAELAERACADAARRLGAGWTAALVRKVAGSPEQFADVTGLPNAQKATLDAYDGKEWAPLVDARRALASIARGKLEAGLARVSSDGRLRDSLLYVGAHTWRWSHRGMQLGNVPRPDKQYEEWGDADICRAADAVLAGDTADASLIDVLLRATVVADSGELAVCDYSGVESRALAWCAGDEGSLETIALGRDPYKAAAVDVYGVPYDAVTKPQRQVGKVAVLALGYQGSWRAFEKMARDAGVSLEGVDVPDVVAAWRRAHRATVQFWYELGRAFIRAADGVDAHVSCFTFTGSGSDVIAWLPSGRPIVYNDVRLRRDERGRPKVSYAPARPGPGTYLNEDGELRSDTYGGKLTENLIQALCRDLMADALVRAEAAGLAPVLHVHDEIVCEVPRGAEGLDVLRRIMLTLPDWAEGFPIGAAGHSGRRYRK